MVDNWARHPVNEVTSSEKSFIPKMQWERRMGEECKACLNKMAVFTLRNPILLRCMRARNTMGNANTLEIFVETMIFPSPVRLNSPNFGVKETFNMILKSIKDGLNIRFVLQKINPAETAIIVNKANIILISSR